MFGPGVWRAGGMMDSLWELQRMQGEMNRVFSGIGQSLNQEVPPLNAWVGEGDVIVAAELSGVDPGKVDISVVGDTLTISGSREAETLKEGRTIIVRSGISGGFRGPSSFPSM
jgi:HSP20 family protein